jgi:hypothetical protein
MSNGKGCKMPSKSVTLKVDSDIYDKYRDFCKKKGVIVSRQFEIMMEDHLQKGSVENNGK